MMRRVSSPVLRGGRYGDVCSLTRQYQVRFWRAAVLVRESLTLIYNGAKNIAALGLSVNQPGGPWLSCEVSSLDFVARQLTIWDILEGYEKPAS